MVVWLGMVGRSIIPALQKHKHGDLCEPSLVYIQSSGESNTRPIEGDTVFKKKKIVVLNWHIIYHLSFQKMTYFYTIVFTFYVFSTSFIKKLNCILVRVCVCVYMLQHVSEGQRTAELILSFYQACPGDQTNVVSLGDSIYS